MRIHSARKVTAIAPNGKMLLNSLSFDQPLETVLGLYGPNGSGKSTLLRALSGTRQANTVSGEFWVDGVQVTAWQEPRERSRLVLYIGSDFHTPYDLTVRELLEMGATADQVSLWPEILSAARTRMGTVVESLKLTNFLPRVFRTLSDGEKQMVMFGRCLIQNPKLLILDETFSKLDLDHLADVTRVLEQWKKNGMSFLIASHDLNFLSEVSEELLFLKNGLPVAKGKTNEVLTPHSLEQIYPDLPIQVVRSPESGKSKILY